MKSMFRLNMVSFSPDGRVLIEDAELLALEADFTVAEVAGGRNTSCANSGNSICTNVYCYSSSNTSSCGNYECSGARNLGSCKVVRPL